MATQFETPYRPISVDEFDKMVDSGIIGPDERVELVDGRIVLRERMNAPHASIVARIMHVLMRRLGGEKLRLYAKTAIPEYWIVDVKARTVEVCRDPHDLGYGSRSAASRSTSVAFAAFPDVVFSVDELLG